LHDVILNIKITKAPVWALENTLSQTISLFKSDFYSAALLFFELAFQKSYMQIF